MRIIITSALITIALALPHVASGQPTPAPPDAEIEVEPVGAGATTTVSATPTHETQGAWTFGIAPRLALTVPTSKLGATVVGGLELDFALPVAQRRLVLALDVTMTRPSYDGTGTDPRVNGAYTYDVKELEGKIALDVIFRMFTAEKKLVPYVGAGPLLHLLRTTEMVSFAPGDNMEQSTKLGFEVVGGADYRAGPGLVLAEVRVVYSDLDHLFTGDTNAGNVMVGLGYRLVF